jgi:hypothetical protein
MPAATQTRPRRRPAGRVRPIRGRAPARADARAQELEARRALAQAFARMERAHALAAHHLAQFDTDLSEIRKRLRRAGYLLPRP